MSADRIQIHGRVAEDAHVAPIPKSKPRQYALTVKVAPAEGLPYVITENVGEDRGQVLFAARSRARLLRQGTWVCAYGTHLQVRREAGKQVLHVQATHGVLPFGTLADHTHQAERSTEATSAPL